MDQINQFKVDKEEKNLRLDKFLVKKINNLSRSLIQKKIKNGLILVNDKKTNPHYNLICGDVVSLIRTEILEIPKAPRVDLEPDSSIKFNVIFENKDFLIINKPVGLVVHPSLATPRKTLINGLLAHWPALAKVGDDPLRPGLVHRLDKEVSGLMVIAKTANTFDHLKKQFKERHVRKEYLALVYGSLIREEGVINFDIKRSKRNPLLWSAIPTKTGRRALTYFEVIKHFVNYTYLKLEIKTGRTHQIRVHLKAIGHPVVGDQLYRIKKYKEKIKLDRAFLHASKLGFYDLQGQWQEFEAPLPDNLLNILNTLK